MATNAAPQSPVSLERRAVLVHVPGSEKGCLAQVRMGHDCNLCQGSITIKTTLKLAGFDQNPQPVILNILPSIVDSCIVIPRSDDSIIPTEMLHMLRGVNEASAVSTMILRLNTPGVVLVPGKTTSVSPSDPSDLNFHAFSRICQAETIHVHFSRQQLKRNDMLWIRNLAGALCESSLSSPQINYTHFNGGRGVQERDWTVFKQSRDPPSYRQIVPPSPVLGKRSQHAANLSPLGSAAQRLVSPCSPPPWSPTEVNTPSEVHTPSRIKPGTSHNSVDENDIPPSYSTSSTRSPTPIRPTVFTGGGETKQDLLKVQRVQELLADIPDRLVRKILGAPRYQYLIATQQQEEVEPEHSIGFARGSDLNVEEVVKRYLDQFIKECLPSLTKDAFERHAEQRLDRLVENRLPVAAEMVLCGAVEDYRDQFYEDCKIYEAHLQETVDEGRNQLLETVEECSTEIEELAHKHVRELEDQSEEIKVSVGDQLANLDYRSHALARLVSTEAPALEGKARCKSV